MNISPSGFTMQRSWEVIWTFWKVFEKGIWEGYKEDKYDISLQGVFLTIYHILLAKFGVLPTELYALKLRFPATDCPPTLLTNPPLG
jgi:hypothetical protein